MKKLFLLLVVNIILVNSCLVIDPKPKYIEIENCTDSAIYVYYSFKDSLEESRSIELFKKYRHAGIDKYISPDYRINAFSTGGIGITGRESLLNESADKKIRLFFIKEETMRNKTWDYICKHQIYIKKMTFSSEELKKINWSVKYP